MTPNKFNWFLHSMLFYHTRYVLMKQEKAKNKDGNDDDDDDDEDDDEEEEEGIEI
jgi:hypothetical protein